MDAPTQLWAAWCVQVQHLFPHLHGHQQKSLAWVALGVVLSGSAVLQRMAEGLYGSGSATMPSIERRLARFVANDRIGVTPVWTQFLAQVLPFWRERRVFLVLDCTPVDDRATSVYLGLLVQARVLPLAWQVMPAQKTWPEGPWAVVKRLFDQGAPYLEQTDCTVLADRGLVGLPLVQLCRACHWHYLLRVRREHTCRRWMGRWTAWRPLGQLLPKPGQQWCGCWTSCDGQRIHQFCSGASPFIDRAPLGALLWPFKKCVRTGGPGGRFPQNFRFQVADALKPFPFADAAFDFVHARLISPFVPFARWPDVVGEMVRVLRPGA